MSLLLTDYKNIDLNHSFVAFDVETTGFYYANGDKIIEIAALRFDRNSVVEKLEFLINPQRLIPLDSQKVHHITNEMVQTAPLIEEILPSFLNFIKDAYLVGHNIYEFDCCFIDQVLRQYEFSPLINPIIDTLKMARSLVDTKNHKLDTLAKHFQIDTEQIHRASSDVEINIKVFWQLYDLALKEKD